MIKIKRSDQPLNTEIETPSPQDQDSIKEEDKIIRKEEMSTSSIFQASSNRVLINVASTSEASEQSNSQQNISVSVEIENGCRIVSVENECSPNMLQQKTGDKRGNKVSLSSSVFVANEISVVEEVEDGQEIQAAAVHESYKESSTKRVSDDTIPVAIDTFRTGMLRPKYNGEETSEIVQNLNNSIARKLKPNINIKFWFSVFYIFFLAVTLNSYTIFDVILGITLSLVSASVNMLIITYLKSKSPSDRTILHNLFIMNCIIKLLTIPYAIVFIVVGHFIRNYGILTQLTFLFSLRAFRAMFVLHVSMYVIISVFRLILFVSPELFINTNKKLVEKIAAFLLALLTSAEYLIGKFAYAQCKYTPHGINWDELFRLPTKSTKETKHLKGVCYLFPSLLILSILFFGLEAARLIAATIKETKKIKVHIQKDNFQRQVKERELLEARSKHHVTKIKLESYQCRRRSAPQALRDIVKPRRSHSIGSSLYSKEMFSRTELPDNSPPERLSNEISEQINSMQKKDEKKNDFLTLTAEVSKFLKFMIMRAYSIVIFALTFTLLVNIFAPEALFTLKDLELRTYTFFSKVEFLAVPILWVLMENEMYIYIKNVLKKFSLEVKAKILNIY